MGELEGRPDSVRNTVAGSVSGPVVQAREVHGDVTLNHHQHLHRESPDPAAQVAVVTRLVPGSAQAGGMFSGRGAEAERILTALAPDSGDLTDGTGPVVVSAIAGMGGVGKTALARHCAVRAAARGWFPGGVFWVDLQGYSGEGMVTAGAVLSPLLRQLGVEADHVPDRTADQAAVYDQTLRDLAEAGRAVLLVLDNASTVDQLHGLLPALGDHRALITTRDTLALPGARRLLLDVLPIGDAVTVLDRALRRQDGDDDRVTTDPTGATRLAEVCGGLPLAVLIVAGLLADEPHLTSGTLAEQLAGTSTAGFTHGETRLATVFNASYYRLRDRDPDAAQLLRMLALAPGVDIDTVAAAALAAASPDRVRTLLRVLRQVHLITTDTVDRWRGSPMLGSPVPGAVPGAGSSGRSVDDQAAWDGI
ncbi:NB-ARC domain-containing protein [Saccharothrix carnea]|uniref:NB-ARC domain-containing protein n=1 Tax=Saccharothrix carnea TaxID=1280637 RepID=A0A2P8I4G1_SACCR|nr:ATP-binding protein [Saccharothrix carnea]PSL53324.1 NB-ARC domain-containing protein [Saccharothrix carnea]